MSDLANICSMTGEPLKHPVVSSKTGHVFQKQVIEKHLSTFSTCPITNMPLEVTDLIYVTENNKNTIRSNPTDSVPAYMEKLKHEYDTLSLETFNLRSLLNSTRQEILHTKTRNHAAECVIRKMIKEKEQSENEINELTSKLKELKK